MAPTATLARKPLSLELIGITLPGNCSRSAYHFLMRLDEVSVPVGESDLRTGNGRDLRYLGYIGYFVDSEFQGNPQCQGSVRQSGFLCQGTQPFEVHCCA